MNDECHRSVHKREVANAIHSVLLEQMINSTVSLLTEEVTNAIVYWGKQKEDATVSLLNEQVTNIMGSVQREELLRLASVQKRRIRVHLSYFRTRILIKKRSMLTFSAAMCHALELRHRIMKEKAAIHCGCVQCSQVTSEPKYIVSSAKCDMLSSKRQILLKQNQAPSQESSLLMQ